MARNLLALFLAATAVLRADNKVNVHEWGTFTCLQDEQGRAIGGINVDDEPVPSFVWGAETVRRHERGHLGLPPYMDQIKGWRPADPDVTMRLETPVLYFYPPKGTAAKDVPPLDVYVKFHGGVLSQYYPYAITDGMPPDFPRADPPPIGTLNSGLTWKGVQLGTTAIPVPSDDPVWTTPREVSAPMLAVPSPVYDDGQMHLEPLAEHFLFYRGLGHLDSPVRIVESSHDQQSDRRLLFEHGLADGAILASSVVMFPGWTVQIESNHSCAFRQTDFFVQDPDVGQANAERNSTKFSNADFSSKNLTRLKSSMHAALVQEGLYEDEATAMLKTWELSYFKSPGLRFFYIAPRAWVDKELPLTITGAPTEITRVMVGRIELISDAQKSILARLTSGPCPDFQALKEQGDAALTKSNLSDKAKEPYYSGAKPLTDFGVSMPPLVQDYLSLGRFRDALIVHEQQERPSAALAQFIKDNQLSGPPH